MEETKYQGFSKNSGPAKRFQSKPAFGFNDPSPSSPITTPIPPSTPSSIESPGWSDGQNMLYKDLGGQTPERTTSVAKFIASRDSKSGITARVYRSPPLLESTRSPPISYADIDDSRNPNQTVLMNKPALAHSTLDGQANLSVNYPNFSVRPVQSSLTPSFDSQNPRPSFTKELNQGSKRTRSPPSSSTNIHENFNDAQKDFRRPSISSRLGSTSNILKTSPHSQLHQISSPFSIAEAAGSRPIISTAPKRTRSPPSFSPTETLERNSEDNSEREMLAKAKRLARFKVELSKSEHHNDDTVGHTTSVLEKKDMGGHMDSASNITNGHGVNENEGQETSNVIIGLCPDMCPESERGERERKGDLDQYERVDGDRNVTSRLLAVKKYTRTAEREASLIRPMPILKKTIGYLLTLLDQPYDERFLGIYNFLWDRMRAIRMDLRMQHIFNQGAITMLEQMIKLHIIAMHELCEYTKGEGFSEGFDAHLNIEQMNKASVELFQLYDDHRKKGVYIPTEKEFRGYYALLKLDKHPGYKVEPAELSLDLAKMTPEIRQTPEVLFARNVARACRTGNFIAFFRLARKATYLQACLMHAHFAKLRTQALASLHSGVQNNQGLPVAHVANWLAMEDEDIEVLLEYHGFLIKAFGEPYMVKEGLFLNADTEYPTKCSKLVHKKRSGRIVEDVSPSIHAELLPGKTMKEIPMMKTYKHEPQTVSAAKNNSSVQKLDEKIPESKAIYSPKDSKSGKALREMQSVQNSAKDYDMARTHPSPLGFPFDNIMPEPQQTRIGGLKIVNSYMVAEASPRRNSPSNVDARSLEIIPKTVPPEGSLTNSFFLPLPVAQSASKDDSMFIHQEHEDEVHEVSESCHDEEVAEAKLKLFLRLWRRRVSKLRMLREERQLASSAALNSLPLGPPIRHCIEKPCNFDKFDIDVTMRERYETQENSQSRLNVSDVVGDTIARRNPDAKCLCWKIILCSQKSSAYEMGKAGLWLTSKIMPCSDNDVVISSPDLVIWRKWIRSQSDIDPTCCFSVIRDTAVGIRDEVVSGASGILFLVSESISWKHQRVNLHNLLMSIPSDACLPLLILCSSGSYDERSSSVIINELGLQDIDNLRVSSFLVVFLRENQQMKHLDGFFSDTRLREGLQWLAGESPSQPNLHRVKIRELVHMHISSFSGVQDIISNSKLSPNDCISLFNKALDYSMQEIIAAANSNPAGWPCPEIGLLDKSFNEDRVVKSYLPTLGWSSNEKTQPIIHALQNCKLPIFTDDLSWLARGSKVGQEIENQKTQLENCLIQYLTHTSNMMGISLAAKEARVITQTCAKLELCGSSYRVVPHWGLISRRIFNWRLTGLSSREISAAYISEHHHNVALQNMGFEACLSSSYYTDTSLDEMISVICNSPLPANDRRPRPEALHGLPHMNFDDETTNLRDAESNLRLQELPNINTGRTYGINNAKSESLLSKKPSKEADKLSKLLEQCNLLQDGIDKKLSVYF
ncbi:SAC3 family protein B isoform X2 [Vicia villosa]|uniref:SAC3 family protein B isoform X2 n=1 Tax=Vicia villosa TaxID=3911 RepID=UPI00273B6801|nr:SAC3 family protein B isoform X2 [Vicia villosa]